MPSSAVRARTAPQPGRRTRRFALVSVACVVAATAVNLGLYAVGRATDAALRVDPGVGEPNHLIVVGDVAWKTAVPLVLGAVVFALIASRSRRWTTIAIAVGAAGAAATIPFVVTGAHDAVTGALLASMHATTGLAYVMIGVRARLDIAADGGS